MLDDHTNTERTWQNIAEEMTHEQDSEKLLQLAKELDQSMQNEEREKVRRRLGLDKAG